MPEKKLEVGEHRGFLVFLKALRHVIPYDWTNHVSMHIVTLKQASS